MNYILRTTIRKRLIGGFTIIIAVILIVQLYTITYIRKGIVDFSGGYTKYSTGIGEIGNSYGNFYKGISELLKLKYVDESKYKTLGDNAKSYIKASLDGLSAIEESIKNDKGSVSIALYDNVYEGIEEIYNTMNIFLQKIYTGYSVTEEELNTMFAMANSVDENIQKLFVEIGTEGYNNNNSTKKVLNTRVIESLAISVLLVFFILFVEITTIKSIKVVIKVLKDAAKRLVDGDVNVDIKSISKDEIGEVTDEIADMIETIKEQAVLADEISNGNLNLKINPKSEVDALGNALKRLVDKNNITLGGIKDVTNQVSTSAEEVSSASQALAQGTTEQASAIEQITASIEDITEKTKVNAEDAKNASSLVNKAKERAVQGNMKMTEMIEAMNDINISSENISKIIKVIDDIAFQTNILALNAAVEAARAGEHGKGFAVVAEEVGNLASKSAAAASETAELIENSISKVERGSRLAKDTSEALEHISEVIDKTVTLVDSIAVSSDSQSIAIAQIDQAITQVSEVVQNNSATSEECAASSQELAVQADKLRDMMSRYKLRDTVFNENSNYGGSYNNTYSNKSNTALSYGTRGEKTVMSLTDDLGKY